MTDIKQAIVLRSNIGMSPGKACGQAAHASIMAYLNAQPALINDWISKYNQTKIVLAVRSEECLFDIEKNCIKKGIPCAVVQDAGKTELEPGTVTAIGVGPGPAFLIDSITGNLPLYKGDEVFKQNECSVTQHEALEIIVRNEVADRVMPFVNLAIVNCGDAYDMLRSDWDLAPDVCDILRDDLMASLELIQEGLLPKKKEEEKKNDTIDV